MYFCRKIQKTIKIINKAHNKRRNYHAAVVSAKKHINDCIIYAKTPLPINELNASSENNTLNIETNVNSTTNNKINAKPDDKEKM